jgi:hypothetical protein
MIKQTNAKKIVKKIKDKEEASKKVNITFRLTSKVIEDFKKACEKSDVYPGHVVEEMMTSFIESFKKGK